MLGLSRAPFIFGPPLHRSYVFLGDCAVWGIYSPPPYVTVLRDSDPARALAEGKPPALARPIHYVRVSRGARRNNPRHCL